LKNGNLSEYEAATDDFEDCYEDFEEEGLEKKSVFH
jgi:hypothetical protein